MNYTQLDANTGVMKIYGHITEWWNSAEEFAIVFEEMESKFKNIHIRLHCFGGSVFEGTVIANAIAKSKSIVTGYVDGVAASMGSIILQACHRRVMADNSFQMLHRPSGYTQGDSDAHAATARMLVAMEKNFIKTYARRSGKSENDVKGYLDGNDHWLSAEESLEANLVDEVSEAVAKNVATLAKPEGKVDVKSVYGRYTAQLNAPAPPTTTSKTNNDKMKQALIARFNLTGVDENTPDASFVDVMGKHFDKLTQENKRLVTGQIDAAIASAEAATGKKFDETTRTALASIGQTSGIETLQIALGLNAPVAAANPAAAAAAAAAAVVATPRVVALVNTTQTPGAIVAGNPNDPRASWTWDDYQEKDVKALEDMQINDEPRFTALYKAKYNPQA